MPTFSYLTIQTPSTGTYKESGSKFLAFAIPVQSESEIKEHLELLRKKYYDATHCCYAWILGSERDRFRSFDDGEPNHSAGDPILGQIRSRQLTNILVVVVRYFGGTKLGVGGLAQAYKLGAEAALNYASIVEKQVQVFYSLSFPYLVMPEVMKLLKDSEASTVNQHYQELCELTVSVNLCNRVEFDNRLNLLKALGHTITFVEISNPS